MRDPVRNVWTIAKRELAGYFMSPVAYIFIIIFLVLVGFFTFMVGEFLKTNEASLAPFFFWHQWLFLFLVPAIGMRLWSEERRSGTIELLLTMPVTIGQAILGKFLAAWLILALALALTFPMVITVNYLGDPDNGVIFAGYLGSLLVAGTYLSVSMAMSATTRNQVVAFITAVVGCLFLLLAGWPPITQMLINWAPHWVVDTVAGFSVIPHYDAFQRGIVAVQDLLYFFSVMGFALFVTGVVLHSRRGT